MAAASKASEQERAELQALLSSGVLLRAPNLAQILSYVCEKYFQGQADQIKEYNVAVDALGRPPDFNPKLDAIVRVEAHRLRKRLKQYYEAEGAGHAIEITIPPGQYAPAFVTRSPEALQRTRSWKQWAAVATIVLLALAVAGLAGLRSGRPAAEPSPVVTPEADVIRILAGSSVTKFVDSQGNTWGGDRFVTGGSAMVSSPGSPIARTQDPAIFQNRREGDFQYDIPLKPGTYELHLLFAETTYGAGNLEGGGETSRLMNLTANGKPLLSEFDIISDAGGSNTADIKVFPDISPGPDGFLHLRFAGLRSRASLSGLEILPGVPGKMQPVRIVTREVPVFDKQGRLWGSDRFFSGGRTVGRTMIVAGTPEPDLYRSERYGNFSYTIPVAPDRRYTVTLRFAETWFGPTQGGRGGAGSRLFDVLCNGVVLLKSFDIYKEAGGEARSVEKTFRGLTPNAQGKLVLSFVPIKNYACINAIEVAGE